MEHAGQIGVQEIKKAFVKEYEKLKAAEQGDIPIEVVKYGPDILVEYSAQVMNKWMIDGDEVTDD